MSWFARLPRQKAGHPIRARTINRIAETAEQISKFRVCPPLSLNMSAAGLMLRYLGPLFGVYIVLTDGTISARVGTTPGTGTAIIQTFNGTILANLQKSGTNVTTKVYSISSTTGGIPTGVYGIALLIFGVYWLITVDCGN